MAVPVAPNIIPFFVRVFVCCDLVARHGEPSVPGVNCARYRRPCGADDNPRFSDHALFNRLCVPE